jgi:hypothetical protein
LETTKRHITNGNCFAAHSGGSGYEKTQSGFRPLWVFVSATFFVARKMLRIFLIGQQKTSVT